MTRSMDAPRTIAVEQLSLHTTYIHPTQTMTNSVTRASCTIGQST